MLDRGLEGEDKCAVGVSCFTTCRMGSRLCRRAGDDGRARRAGDDGEVRRVQDDGEVRRARWGEGKRTRGKERGGGRKEGRASCEGG